MVSKVKSYADHKVGEGYYILRYRNPGWTRLPYRGHFLPPRFHLPSHR
jgi:hypothetical protein